MLKRNLMIQFGTSTVLTPDILFQILFQVFVVEIWNV